MKLLDGKYLSSLLKEEIKNEVELMVSNGGPVPHIAAILVGNDGASETYVASKIKSCAETGIRSTLIRLPESTSEAELLQKIEEVNNNKEIHGLIVQLPLPKHISEDKVTQAIHPAKDVDGFHPVNVGRLCIGMPSYVSATPSGIMNMLERYNIETEGKHCVVLGRSNIVGTPVSILLSRNKKPGNCTVTLCHSKTPNIKDFTTQADILVVALGKPGFVTADMVKPGAVVVDVGITRINDSTKKSGYRISGDVNFDEVAPLCSYITPVPGGVGLMTIISLLKNTLKAAKKEIYQNT